MINLIAAVDEKLGIGRGPVIPWQQQNDMQRFKAITYGHTVVCGRKTFQTFPPSGLPMRNHLVLTRDESQVQESMRVRTHISVRDLMSDEWAVGELYIIGGAEIYKEFLPYADKMMLTRIHADCGCDVFFPEFDTEEWTRVASEHYTADALRNQYDYSFETYRRKK